MRGLRRGISTPSRSQDMRCHISGMVYIVDELHRTTDRKRRDVSEVHFLSLSGRVQGNALTHLDSPLEASLASFAVRNANHSSIVLLWRGAEIAKRSTRSYIRTKQHEGDKGRT